eukprot:6523198-Prymnesium_polylepis.1
MKRVRTVETHDSTGSETEAEGDGGVAEMVVMSTGVTCNGHERLSPSQAAPPSKTATLCRRPVSVSFRGAPWRGG